MKRTNQDLADSTFFWGVGKTYRLGAAVAETSWERVAARKKQKIERQVSAIARKIKKKQGKVKPSVKTKVFFCFMRFLQKRGWNEADVRYWQEKGWSGKGRPWK